MKKLMAIPRNVNSRTRFCCAKHRPSFSKLNQAAIQNTASHHALDRVGIFSHEDPFHTVLRTVVVLPDQTGLANAGSTSIDRSNAGFEILTLL